MRPDAALIGPGIVKRFGKRLVLDDAELVLQPGEVVALVGENGAGKTSLLRICAGLLAADAGTLERRRSLGYCPQQLALFDHLTAHEHLVLFGRALGLGRASALREGSDPPLADLVVPHRPRRASPLATTHGRRRTYSRKESPMTFPTTLALRGRKATRKCIPVAVLTFALFMGAAHPASATLPATANGSFAFLSDTVTPMRSADGNLFLGEVASIEYSGGLTGVVTATDTIVVHGDGSLNGHGTETCTSCTIGGRTGSFTAVFEFTGANGQFQGTYTFSAGAGGLTGLHGQGAFQGNFASNDYSYDYHFEP
jgi:ABC-type Fe3+/spermidine/putrescine transport system ATPase subunit